MRLLLLLFSFFIAEFSYSDNGFWNVDAATQVPITLKNMSSNKNKQIINISGSTTVSNVLNLLADKFEQNYKNIQIKISGGGSSSAVRAMLNNSATIGQMSRAMKQKEWDAFVKHYGYEPVEFKIAVDALAVYVNKKNPVDKLTSTQLLDLFSDSHHINYWGELKSDQLMTPNWEKQLIQVYTLPKIAGAYSLFNKRMLKKAGYKISAISEPTSSSVVQSVGVNPGGITFASSFYKTRRTQFVALEGKDGQFYEPVQPWISSFKYPVSRYLYLYINQKPGTKLVLKNKQLLAFLMADATQLLIKRAGFYSVSDKIRTQQLERINQ